ncbi:MAG: carbohydrate kinase family protein [Thermofilaceae archaeon]|nr:carbohydrate kinase family protein [Thermofilaceae archaeon]MCX8181309.1 carbohydrate kinase family protein [Thermofilaceae archaeon]MDW8004652.1 carbohydrate kinase family protein [Thermofilaceae archaeon]
MKTLSVGNANVDLLLYVEEPPACGAQVEACLFEKRPGGAASNFAVAAAKLGVSSSILCCVGSDSEGDWLLRELEACGVETSLVAHVEAPTGFVVIVVDKRGERSMIAFRGANALLAQAVRSLNSSLKADWVHVASVKPDTAEAALAIAKSLGCNTSYDPGSLVAKVGLRQLEDVFRFVDVLFLNEFEAATLMAVDYEEMDHVFEKVPVTVVKMGSKGSRAAAEGCWIEAPAFPVEAVDTTGAGDAFDAGFVFAYASGLSLREALIFANACGALKVTRRGSQASPSLSEVINFLKERGFEALASKLLMSSESFNRKAMDR